MTGRMWVEAWSPEYGSSYGIGGPESPWRASGDGQLAEPVGEAPWAPIAPAPSEAPPMAFLDGVSRVDARVFLETAGPPAAGLCGSVGVGAMLANGRSRFGPTEIHRAVVFGAGEGASLPPVPGGLSYDRRSAPGDRPEDIRAELERLREDREGTLAAQLAADGWAVIADGRLRRVEPVDVIGYIKSHQGRYLSPDLEPVVPALAAGERTPVFALARSHHYSWYLRLAPTPGSHPWAGIARCEVSASLPLTRVVELADLTAGHLPRFASQPFWDTRSPQNLVPIATLERRMWHLLGDRELVLRRIRTAVSRVPEPARA